MFTQEELTNALQKGLDAKQRQLLRQAHVAIAGLGGLGSNAAVWLARLGVGNLTLIDFDKVELSNLNRQYYFLQDVGEYKASALHKLLRQINPYGAYQIFTERLTEKNIPRLLGDAAIICEALDNAADKALLANTILADYPEKYLVAVSGIAGFDSSAKMQVRQINERFFLCGDGQSDCSSLPLCGARVGLCAAQQALTIARIILGLTDKK